MGKGNNSQGKDKKKKKAAGSKKDAKATPRPAPPGRVDRRGPPCRPTNSCCGN